MTDEFVRDILKQFNDSSIVELDFSRNGARLALKKKEACAPAGTSDPQLTSPAPASSASAVSAPAAAAPAPEAAAPVSSEPEDATGEPIKSPVVGTFYRAPSPDAPAYAEPGKTIKKGEPLCIIEAMKMMNTLTAEFDLEVLAVLPENGDLVEFDQPLFTVKRL